MNLLLDVVPVAVMSGATDAEARALQLGAVATLTKPLDFDTLVRVVRRLCVSGRTRDAETSSPGPGTGGSSRPEL